MVDDTFQLVAVHLTADIHPSGGARKDGADTASISTTYVLANEADAEDAARSLGGEADGPVVTTQERIRLEPTDNGTSISLTAPPAGTLVKGAEFVVAILLPPTVVRADQTLIQPVLGRYTTDPAPQLFDGKSLPALGGRTTVVWQGFEDPNIDLEYWYRQVGSS